MCYFESVRVTMSFIISPTSLFVLPCHIPRVWLLTMLPKSLTSPSVTTFNLLKWKTRIWLCQTADPWPRYITFCALGQLQMLTELISSFVAESHARRSKTSTVTGVIENSLEKFNNPLESWSQCAKTMPWIFYSKKIQMTELFNLTSDLFLWNVSNSNWPSDLW